MKRPARRYQSIPRSGEACGTTVLRLPAQELFADYRAEFLRQTLPFLQRGIPTAGGEDMLEQAGLGPQARNLDEWFQGHATHLPPLRTDSAASMNEVADACEDVARDDGLWKKRRSEERRVGKECRL